MVETALQEAVASDVELLSKASRHIISSGGKRLRPRIVLLGYEAAGGTDITQAVPLAAAVELLHTASLVHDDINDRSDTRRGQETVNAQWGNDLALLVGDFVFVKLLSLVADFDSQVIKVLADCCTAIVEGETAQVLYKGNTGMSEDDYLAIVTQKTASLISACGHLGALLAKGNRDQVSSLKDYGLNLGIAFQIRDDTLDLVGDSDVLGKPVASDLEQSKISLAVLFAIKASEKAGKHLSLSDLQRAPHILGEAGAIEYAMQRANEYSEKAKSALSILPDSEAKHELCRLADYAIARDR
jgi:geranylgeranyl pyrophosphate synthase